MDNHPGHDGQGREGDEPVEGRITEHTEDGDFDEQPEAEFDEDDNPRDHRRSETFGTEAIFGPGGVFGPEGPFGRNGPFGPDGPFGNNGPFAGAGIGMGKGRGRWKMGGVYDAGQHHRHGHQHHRRRKRMFGPGELRLVLLSLIAEAPRHGYELIKEIEDLTGGEYAPSPGVIYPTLSLLEDEGMIAPVESDESRKAFRVTDAGKAELEGSSAEVASLMRRLGKQAERSKPRGSPDLLRALGNLATVITNRAANGQFSGEDKDKVVDLIDELARKIERL
ncbi:MAG: PadR family transcriptional regulator [Citromicrobium sp.]|nr:PadR family transcriptional regulator [Citromicrobium sp.]MAO95799.1 PadR family transcriptional regulator [Citromicrobium sp.]MBT46300.1 PadR family transcriptional regulator [Citromicrobium sp.]